MPSLVIVSNRLPVSVKKVDGKLVYFPSVGGLSSALASYTKSGRNKWIGWPGMASDELTKEEMADITRHLKKQNCYPVFLTQKQLNGFYNGYSNSVLWPLFHNLPVTTGDNETNWKAYKAVNKLYAEETLRLAKPTDNLWIHDYQLLLMPEMVRVAWPKSQIGFFLHIPFPESKTFSATKRSRELIRGVLGSGLIGMHTSSYVDNFLDTVRHAQIGLVAPNKVALSTRIVRVADLPIGINYERFAEAGKSLEVTLEYNKLLWKYRGKKVILTIDRLDPSKGLVERLEAYKTLLEQNPDLHEKVVFVMQAMPSRTEIAVYQKLRVTLDNLVEEINARFSTPTWQPVEPIYSAKPFAEYAALFRRADVAFIAPIRDGMNLVAKEYLASRPKGDGVLVLSETAGAAEELKDALLVNPSLPETLVDGLKSALSMKPADFIKRTRKMQRYLKKNTVDKWATTFIETLEKPLPAPQLQLTRPLDVYRTKSLVYDYHQSRKRLLLFDYDGTLQPIVKHPEDAKPSRQTLAMLKRLGSDKRNEVVIISGRDRTVLDLWVKDLPVTLVAEHGAYIKRRGAKTWHKTHYTNSNWKNEVEKLFNDYAHETPGVMIEHKEWAIVWHYRNASPFYAQKNLVALRRLLKPVIKKERLVLKEGKKALEVHHLDISKSHITQEWLLNDQDFVLAIGDDATDEDMFVILPPESYSIKVGRGRSAANYRLPDPTAVHALLRKL